MKNFWGLVCLFFTISAFAGDERHRYLVTLFSEYSHEENEASSMPWFSTFTIATHPADFKNASGTAFMKKPGKISSAYSAATHYDVSNFYEIRRSRANAVINFKGRGAGEIFSIGYDSGSQSEKIAIHPAFFLGYANTVSVQENIFLTYSLGGWLGGSVKEKPCFDSYERAYWCQNLTAWQDYAPQYPRPLRYMDLRLFYQF